MSCMFDLWRPSGRGRVNRPKTSLCDRLALTLFSSLLLPVPAVGEPLISVDAPDVEELLSVDALPPGFYTFTPDEYWQEPKDSVWMDFSNWVLTQPRRQGERVQILGEWADRTLSGSARALPNNESYLRIGFATESEYSNLAQFEPEARFRLDIPTVEEKMRVVIESESEELIPLSERQRSRQLTEDERSDTQATGALRFLSEVGDAIDLSNDLGVRLRLPADAFVRTSARKRWAVDDNWSLILDQRIYYFHQDGWGERTWLGVGRNLGNGWGFLSASELEWVHRERKFEFAQTLNFSRRLNNRSTIDPRLGILGDSESGWRQTNVFADVTYRYRLYHDWLYGEIIPAMEFPREHGFKDRASVVLRIEMFFSGRLER